MLNHNPTLKTVVFPIIIEIPVVLIFCVTSLVIPLTTMIHHPRATIYQRWMKLWELVLRGCTAHLSLENVVGFFLYDAFPPSIHFC
jgi:hypothetical protein